MTTEPTLQKVKLQVSSMSQGSDKPSFRCFGLNKHLLAAIDRLKFISPTEIQEKCLPHALEGRDIIGIATTGSGKTAAFALPILQKLWDQPQGLFACVLAPTRELAFQISATFEALGEGIGVRCAVVVGGGEDRVTQAITLVKRPHIIIATPGRLLDHLQSTKGFNLRNLKYLVLDEADRLLDMSFGPSIDQILKFIPKDRSTYLFSATMTTQVSKLQRASLSNPVKVEVSSKYQTVPTLLQYFALCPLDKKEALFIQLINSLTANTIITFTRTVQDTERLGIMLRHLGFSAVLLHGQLSQSHRLGALNQFKSGNRRILVATDVASRGLDIPCVDIVINYDVPLNSKDYIHRVGRTARAGRSGKSISIVTQYDVEFIQRIEKLLDRKLEMWPVEMEEILLLKERVDDAGRIAAQELKEKNANISRKRKVPRVSMDDEEDSSRATRNRKRTRR